MPAKVDKRRTRDEKVRLVDEMRRGLEEQKSRSDSLGSQSHARRERACGGEHSDSPSPIVWVEATEKERMTKPDRIDPTIEVGIGTYVVRVSQGFDRALFSEICRTLCELC